MAKTRADLVLAIMENLGAIAAGQSVSAEDYDTIVRRVDPKNEELNARLVGYVPDTNDIEDEYFLPFVKIMAAECASIFGIEGAKAEEVKKGGLDGEEALRAVVRPKGTRQMLVTEPGLWSRRSYGARGI